MTNSQPEKKKLTRKQRQQLKQKMYIACAAIIVAVVLIVVLIIKTVAGGKGAKVTTLTLGADGTVISEEYADFSKEFYSKKEAKQFFEDEIEKYNSTVGHEAIELEKFKVKGEKAYLKTTYETASDYGAFTGYWTSEASLKSALKDGNSFDEAFAKVENGMKGEVVDAKSFAGEKGLSVFVVNQNGQVVVPGEIVYVSDMSTEIVSKNTVNISQADGNEDARDLVYIIYK